MNKAVLRVAAAVIAAASLTSGVSAADLLRQITWDDLMPPRNPQAALTGSASKPNNDPLPRLPVADESDWLTQKRRQPGADQPPRVVPELNGQRVKLAGYVVPLDFEATTVKEFLLVPFVGACFHVPPPPPNQIVYIKSEKGFELGAIFDPVAVTGTIRTETTTTELADVGYSMDADAVEPYAR
jgi:uncharacterized protein